MRCKTTLLVIVVVSMIFISGCGKDQSTVHLAEEDVQVLSLTEYYPLAYELAREWNEEAVPVIIQLEIISPSTRQPNPYLWIRFESPTVTKECFQVLCTFEGCESFLHNTSSPYLEEISYYRIDELEFDSVDAVEIGLSFGGAEILNSPGSAGAISLTWRDGKTCWYVVFYSEIGKLILYIDPVSGQIFEQIDEE